MTQSLVEELRRQNTYESQSETQRRYAHRNLPLKFSGSPFPLKFIKFGSLRFLGFQTGCAIFLGISRQRVREAGFAENRSNLSRW